MKVDEQSELPSTKLEITEELSLVDGKQTFHSLHLHDNQSSDEEIQTITTIQEDSLVIHTQRFLPFEGIIRNENSCDKHCS